jgi:hypothetical protein
MKKAIELSVLCDCELALVVFYEGQLYQYASSGDMDATLQRHYNYEGPQEIIELDDLDELRPGKASSFKVGKLYVGYIIYVVHLADALVQVYETKDESSDDVSVTNRLPNSRFAATPCKHRLKYVRGSAATTKEISQSS